MFKRSNCLNLAYKYSTSVPSLWHRLSDFQRKRHAASGNCHSFTVYGQFLWVLIFCRPLSYESAFLENATSIKLLALQKSEIPVSRNPKSTGISDFWRREFRISGEPEVWSTWRFQERQHYITRFKTRLDKNGHKVYLIGAKVQDPTTRGVLHFRLYSIRSTSFKFVRIAVLTISAKVFDVIKKGVSVWTSVRSTHMRPCDFQRKRHAASGNCHSFTVYGQFLWVFIFCKEPLVCIVLDFPIVSTLYCLVAFTCGLDWPSNP